jgi:hypothetical protein
MALHRIECPHCEKAVELDVTSVTRSRECPNCGKSIMLQFTTTQKRTKRKALMVPAVDAVEKLGEAPHGDHQAPRALEGDVHDRLMHDPEVRLNMKRLVWGAGILAATILILLLSHYLQRGSKSETTSPPPQAATPGSNPGSAPATVPGATPANPTRSTAPSQTSAPGTASPNPVPDTTPPSTAPVMVATSPGPIEEQRALRTVEAFLKAKNLEQRLPLVRDLPLLEAKIRAYYVSHSDGPIPFTKITPEPAAAGSHPIRRFEVELQDGTKRVATTGRTSQGGFSVDWASFVIYSAMDWNDFASRRPTDPVFMRVLAQADKRYEGQFAKEDEFLCLKLTNPLNPAAAPLHGYVSRAAGIGQNLNMILRFSGTDPVPMMLILKHPPQVEGAPPSQGQVLIDKFIGEGWVASGT